MCIGSYPKLEAIINNKYIVALSWLILLGTTYLYYQSIGNNTFLMHIGATSGIIACLALAKHISQTSTRSAQLWSYLGVNSLAIYLLHFFFLFHIPDTIWEVVGDGAGAKIWEWFIALIYAGIVLGFTLLTATIIRSNEFLARVTLGDALKKEKTDVH